MPDKVGYTVTMELNTDRKGIQYLADLIKSLNEHLATVEKIDVDGTEVFNRANGGFKSDN